MVERGELLAIEELAVLLSREDGLVREVTDDIEREGPSLDATSADLSINRLYSYFANYREGESHQRQTGTSNSHRIYCSSSLSLSVSSKLGGGGYRISFGLNIAFDLMFPIDLMIYYNEN